MKLKGIEFEYETKCRRCGEIHSWFGGNEYKVDDKPIDTSLIQFLNHMQEKIQYAKTYSCNTCNRSTVQEIVSYTPDHNVY